MYTEEADSAASNTAEENQIAQAAKSICLQPVSKRAPVLLHALTGIPKPSPLLSMALVEALGSLVCEPGARNTDRYIYEKLLELCSSMGRPLFGLFDHPARGCLPESHTHLKFLQSSMILPPFLIAVRKRAIVSRKFIESSCNIPVWSSGFYVSELSNKS